MSKRMCCNVLQNLCMSVGSAIMATCLIVSFAQRAEAACVDKGCGAETAGCAGGLCGGKDAEGLDCGCGGTAGACSCR